MSFSRSLVLAVISKIVVMFCLRMLSGVPGEIVTSFEPLPQMIRFDKIESAIFVSLMCSLLPENLHSELVIKYKYSPYLKHWRLKKPAEFNPNSFKYNIA